MRAPNVAVAATLALLALVLSGCSEEEAREIEVPCLGGCFTTLTTTVEPSSEPSSGGHPSYTVQPSEPGSSAGGASSGAGSGGDRGEPGSGAGAQGAGSGSSEHGADSSWVEELELGATLPAVRRCYLAPLWPGSGCQLLEQLAGGEFGLNRYGQETTGKRACLDRLRDAGGDTFLFAPGQCELWNCSSAAALRSSAGPPMAVNDTQTVSIRTWKNTLLSVGPDGLLSAFVSTQVDQWRYREQMEASLQVPPPPALPLPAARFQLVLAQDGRAALWSLSADRYVTAQPGGTLSASAEAIGELELFDLTRDEALGTVSLRGAGGLFVSVQDSGEVLAVAPAVDAWERLVVFNDTAASPRAANASAEQPPADRLPDMHVYSQQCQYQEQSGGAGGEVPRAPVFVKLWEWNFVDVARECQDYLGPNGFDAVQVSPVVEHVQGPNWWTKYKPVSYGLNSRSGTRQQFVDMVATCRAAGVEVLVDVILNHHADPCEEAAGRHNAQTPCTGWNGTEYGNRRSAGSQGWDAVDPSFFHHLPGREWDNCGVGADNGYLCGGNDLRDCSCCSCDLYGLPDYNTGLEKVRMMHIRHLFELHDIGVTMLRIDASIYESPDDLSAVLHRVPWDCVYQEWWGEYPVPERTAEVGLYRDVSYRWKIANGLHMLESGRLPELLDLDHGVEGLTNDIAIYPIAYHDGRSNEAALDRTTYKNGLAYHQQQKFLLAWPKSSTPIIWGGFGWQNIEQGPPGCEEGDNLCTPTSVFDQEVEAQCMPTPTTSPLDAQALSQRSWVCEHRWHGVAGLVDFRKRCRGLAVSHTWTEGGAGGASAGPGQLAYRLGQECFVALARGRFATMPAAVYGDWDLSNLATGLPAGRYCDLASLPTQKDWHRTSCPREVTIDEQGLVRDGAVQEGDLLAIHVGARLQGRRRLRAAGHA